MVQPALELLGGPAAGTVGSTAGAVRVAQHRALAKLKTEIAATGYDRG